MDGLQGRRPFPVGVGMDGTSSPDGRERPGAGSPGLVRSPVPAHQIAPSVGHTPLPRAIVAAGGAPGRSSVERMAAQEAGRTLAKPATAQQVREVAPPLPNAAPRTERT